MEKLINSVALFGFDFRAATSVEPIADEVMSAKGTEQGKLPLMITPNVDQVVKLDRKENAALKAQLFNAQWVLPDGQPIVTLSKLIYGEKGLPARLTGSDFFPAMWKRIQESGRSAMFVLPSESLGLRFANEYPDTQFYAPPFFDLNNTAAFEEIMQEVEDRCLAHKPQYVFIGLGFPKQEHIALELFRRLDRRGEVLPCTFLLGASFEFYWGLKKRAPLFWQKIGLEFVHRLFSEPRRMFRRYIIDDSAFLGMAVKEYRRLKGGSRRSRGHH